MILSTSKSLTESRTMPIELLGRLSLPSASASFFSRFSREMSNCFSNSLLRHCKCFCLRTDRVRALWTSAIGDPGGVLRLQLRVRPSGRSCLSYVPTGASCSRPTASSPASVCPTRIEEASPQFVRPRSSGDELQDRPRDRARRSAPRSRRGRGKRAPRGIAR